MDSRSDGSPLPQAWPPWASTTTSSRRTGSSKPSSSRVSNASREALTTIADIEDPYEALREAGRRYRALAKAHPMVYQLMFLRAIPNYEPSDPALEVAGAAFDSLVVAVRRAMVAGVIAEGPLTETAQLIWSSIHGWVSLELLGMGMIEDEDSGFDRVCSTMLRGLRPESESEHDE